MKIREVHNSLSQQMKIALKLISIAIFSLSCRKGEEVEPIPSSSELEFVISCYMADSDGVPLMSYPYTDSSKFSPWELSISDEFGVAEYDVVVYGDLAYGISLTRSWNEIINEASYIQDSMFEVYPCYQQNCDTILIKKTKLTNSTWIYEEFSCYYDQVIYRSDTLDTLRCAAIPIDFKN